MPHAEVQSVGVLRLRNRFALRSDCYAQDDIAEHNSVEALLVAEGLDRVQVGGAGGGDHGAEDAD